MRANRSALLGVTLIALVTFAHASAPDWLRQAAHAQFPSYPSDTRAVVVLSEQTTTVKDSGEITTFYRRAVKILRPEGREEARVVVAFDKETRISGFKAWSITAKGDEYEVKEKDSLETSFSPDSLYEDTRHKILMVPGADPGSVIGYEYEQKRRPSILEDAWWFQDDVPVLRAAFTLRLPSGWEYKPYWSNYAAKEPQSAGGNQFTWQLENLPGIERQPRMPPRRAVAGWLAVHYYPSQNAKLGTGVSWQQIGSWYYQLAASRREATPEIKQKVAELTRSAVTPLDKIKAIANFLQRDVRYVAIEIGIGGYQPHPAQDVFVNRYGDCKDKVTLMSTMLQEVGVESYYVLINATRGVTQPKVPSSRFNHAILAIKLSPEVPLDNLYATVQHPVLGRILFFDPTSSLTPLGFLPSSLQANYGLIVTEKGGELVELPLLVPVLNRFLRVADLALSPDGTLSGSVQEIRSGQSAAARRAQLLEMPANDRRKVLEETLGGALGGFSLVDYRIEGLEDYGGSLLFTYRFIARGYAKNAGNLLLVRPRVLGRRSDDVMEGKERKYPVEFEQTALDSDIFQIALPAGYQIDELPPPMNASYDFAEYRSQTKLEGNVLRYQRDFKVSQVEVPMNHLEDLKKFYRQITEDENNTAVLKREP